MAILVGAVAAWQFIDPDPMASGWPIVIGAGVTVGIAHLATWVPAPVVRWRPKAARLLMELAVPARVLGVAALAATLVAWIGAKLLDMLVAPAASDAPGAEQAQNKAERAAISVGVTAVVATITSIAIDPAEEGGASAKLIRARFRKAFEDIPDLPRDLQFAIESPAHEENWVTWSDRKERAAAFHDFVNRRGAFRDS